MWLFCSAIAVVLIPWSRAFLPTCANQMDGPSRMGQGAKSMAQQKGPFHRRVLRRVLRVVCSAACECKVSVMIIFFFV